MDIVDYKHKKPEYVVIAGIEVPIIFGRRNEHDRGLVRGFEYACVLGKEAQLEILALLHPKNESLKGGKK